MSFGTCPTCGGWAKSAIREVGGDTVYRCARGHKWTPEEGVPVAARLAHNVHDFELEPATVYVTGAILTEGLPPFEAAVRRLRECGLTVVGVHEHGPIADMERDTRLGMDWCATAAFRSYLLRDLGIVAKADVIALLPDWEESLAVTSAVSFARACGIQVMSIEELLDLLRGEKG